jgi:hypothetical protein
VSQVLDRIRQATRHRKKETFTALFHHITPEVLRMALSHERLTSKAIAQ